MESKVVSTLELNELIAQMAREDENFRLALLSDPKAALAKELNTEFPEDTKVEVHVDSPKTLHLIIPAGTADELTDDQLEGVAGGFKGIDSGFALAYGVTLGNQSTGWKLSNPLKDLYTKLKK